MIDIGAILTSSGGAILGFVVASVNREARFNSRVDKELAVLRREVALCRNERTEFAIVKTGLLMVLPEFRRVEPDNPVLLAVQVAFEQLPTPSEDIGALLQRLSEIEDIPDEPDPSGN